MSTVKIQLPGQLNASLQAKPVDIASANSMIDNGAWDIIYFVRISPDTGKQEGAVQRMGKGVEIAQEQNSYTIHVDMDPTAQTPNNGDYIFFGKENKVNVSGVKGYYAEVEMKNDSSSAAKLFSVGSEMSPSSK